MGDFARRVLRLVSDGKISAEEGEELLRAHERAPLRDIRTFIESGVSEVQRAVRDVTEERAEDVLRADLAPSEDPLQLRISGDFALTVQAGESDMCRVVRRVARGFFGDLPAPPRATLEGRTLTVESRQRGGFSMGLPFGGVSLDVYLPKGTEICGAVQQRSGRVELRDLPVGVLRLEAQNGRVRVRTPSLSELAVISRNGSIAVSAERGRELRIEAWNGRVDVSGAIHDVDVTTRNGRIEADLGTVEEGHCRLRTLNGQVELLLPAEMSAEILAETVHGAIFTDVPGLVLAEDVRDLTRRRLHGHRAGSRGDIAAELETTNGAVRVGQKAR